MSTPARATSVRAGGPRKDLAATKSTTRGPMKSAALMNVNPVEYPIISAKGQYCSLSDFGTFVVNGQMQGPSDLPALARVNHRDDDPFFIPSSLSEQYWL